MGVVDGQGLPLGKQLASASSHESKLIEPTLEPSHVLGKIQRLVYGKAAGSNTLRQRMADRGIDLIAPELGGRKRRVQDRRKLRRHRRRWKMEPTFAWVGNYRRLVVRYGRKLHAHSAFCHLACIMIALRAPLTWF